MEVSVSRKIKVEGIMELSQAVSYLENLLNSLKQGNLHLESGQETITLKPAFPIVDLRDGSGPEKGQGKVQAGDQLEDRRQAKERPGGDHLIKIGPAHGRKGPSQYRPELACADPKPGHSGRDAVAQKKRARRPSMGFPTPRPSLPRPKTN